MADRPIIFSASMVRALLAGRKTQTRRLVGDMPDPPRDDSLVHEPKHDRVYFDAYCGGKRTAANPRGMTDRWCWWTRDDREGRGCRIGYVPGDRLYVREACAVDGERHWYRLDHEEAEARGPRVDVRWRPSIHMPRSASRLTLTVTDVRVERLQEISEVDAIAEGVKGLGEEYGAGERPTSFDDGPNFFTVPIDHGSLSAPTATETYRLLWNNLHGAGAWDANPFVAALTFTVEHGNIDRGAS